MAADWTPEAKRDLKEIAKYIGKTSRRPRVADQLLDSFYERADFYADQPGAGSYHPHVPKPLKVFVYKRWVAVYEANDGGGITVLRVVDGSRDFTRLF